MISPLCLGSPMSPSLHTLSLLYNGCVSCCTAPHHYHPPADFLNPPMPPLYPSLSLSLSDYHTLGWAEILLTYIWRCLQHHVCVQASMCIIRVHASTYFTSAKSGYQIETKWVNCKNVQTFLLQTYSCIYSSSDNDFKPSHDCVRLGMTENTETLILSGEPQMNDKSRSLVNKVEIALTYVCSQCQCLWVPPLPAAAFWYAPGAPYNCGSSAKGKNDEQPEQKQLN